MFERVSRFILTRTRATAAITLVTILACIAIIPRIELAEGIESFYERDHPKQAVLDAVEQHFVHGRWLFITYETDDVFSKRALEVVRAVSDVIATRTVEALPNEDASLLNGEGRRRAVADVLSLTSVKDIVGSELSFRNVPLVPEVIPDDPVALRAVRDRALDNHLIKDNLIGVDGRHAGIVARMEPGLGEHRSAEVVDEVRALLARTQREHPYVTFVMTGMPVVDRDIPYITKLDTLKFTPMMLGIAAIILFVSIRRVRGVALALLAISVSSVAAIAMVPLTMSTYNPLCSILLPLVCIQCVSLTLHFLIESGKNLITNPEQDVTHRTLRELLKPVFMCSLSTAIGFASLAFTPTTAIAEFGRIMAASLMMAAFLTTMIIALAWKWKGPAAFVSPRGVAVSRRFASWMTRYLQFLERRWQLVAVIAVVVLLAFTAGAFKLRVGESDIGYFKPSAPARVGATVMEEHLGGATPIIVSIKTNDPERFLDPAELKKLEALDKKLREIAAVDRVTSLVDYLKVMNRAFLGLGREGLVIPENREQVSQLLLLNSDDRVREYVDADHKWVRIVARSHEHETYDLQKMFEELDAYLAVHFPRSQGYDAQVTGEAVVFSLNTDNNTVTQVQGLASAAFTIILLFVVLFRSWSVGLYAILPNAFPIAATLGLMGWLGIELSVATSMISSITIGMVVDDTIHFVQSYRDRVEAHGDVRLAIEESYHVKGPATIFTGIIFTLGFAVFMFADLVPLQHFGLLAACSMFLGALCEITVGPCILLVTRSRLGAQVRAHDAHVGGFKGTIVDVINGRAAAAPQRRALTTVLDGDALEKPTTWGELSASGRAIAGALSARGLGGHRVIVFLGDGGADASILFGVLAAGCVAVPAPAPDPHAPDAHIARLALLIKATDARAVLARRELHGLRERVVAVEPSTAGASWMAPEDRSSVVSAGAPLASDPALLVCDHDDPTGGAHHVVTHEELRAAAEAVRAAMALGPDVTAVAALPLYDPVAIVWTLLAPLVAGADIVMLGQPHVRERPARVLEAIGRHRALYAPVTENLLDRCERSIDAAAAARLRLSTWKMAPVLGAPLRDRVAARFSAALAAAGFEGGWLKPAWTPAPVLGAGALCANVGARRRISLRAFREGRVELAGPGEHVLEIAAIGTPLGDSAVRVVDALTGTPCVPGTIGELHIASKPGAVERATGDLGVVVDGAVYVLGDARESVRIGAARVTPEVIEAGVEAEERLVDGRVTAFFVPDSDSAVVGAVGARTATARATWDGGGGGVGGAVRVVVIAEVDRRRRGPGESEAFDARVIAERVRDAVQGPHGLEPHAVAIVPLGALPRDALGRVARVASRARFQSGEIDSLAVLEEGRASESLADGERSSARVRGTAERTLIDVLRRRADQHGDARVYTFLADGEEPGATLTFAELDRQVRAVASSLEERLPPGSRAMLLYPPGLDFIVAFYACLSAGVIAVPAYPPDPMRLARTLPRLRAVANDADPAAVLTTSAIIDFVGDMLGDAPELARLAWIATDESGESGAPGGDGEGKRARGVTRVKHRPRAEDVAFLQYTSGSTSLPKGVIVTHANLMHNLECIRGIARLSRDSRVVSWLPPYHDMGLIGGILQGVFAGYDTVLFSPLDFMQRPIRWLQAISRFQATGTCGPNFAFELCARKVTAEERAGIDLSSLRTAMNGAEPIRAATLERFAEAFGPCGFQKSVMLPCYGLAESTLIVSGGDEATRPRTRSVLASGLEEHRVVVTEGGPGSRALVGCGAVLGGQDVRFVDPETGVERAPGEVGEIWIRGASIARGYWRRDDETRGAFAATITHDTSGAQYLRTGDLGFMSDGELYVTGRLKDVVIIRGRNHYPHDIELTIERAHAAVRPGCVAAFPSDIDGEEQLIIVAEVDPDRPGFDVEGDVLPALLRAVGTGHDLRPHAIVLIQPRTIAKTTSGKIQRYATRLAWLKNELQTIAHWTAGEGQFIDEVSGELKALGALAAGSVVREAPSPTSLREFLVERIARRLRMRPRDVDVNLPLNSLGLDSADALALSGDLESWLGRRISPTVLYEHPTIAKLVDALASVTPQLAEAHAARAPAGADSGAVAVVGLACRLPQAPDADAFWQLLVGGKNAVREVPPHRWDVDAFYAPAGAGGAVTPGKMNTRFMAWLDDIDRFDASFFGVSPRAAARMDPQQRLLLEIAWQALEDAGISPTALAGTPTGVFVGISTNDYGALQLLLAERDAIDQNTGTGTALSIAANRISYQLDLRGPSMSLDTACSSSLVAVHMACRSLLSGDADTVLAGGVNLILLPQSTVALSQARMMASDGRCKTFDAAADGYVRGEGCGLVVLKRLADAERDGDRVLAVIRGTAMNQDGRSNGLTAPNPLAQVAVIREALAHARTAPSEVTYVEAHGTGTSLGDPIEVTSLASVLSEGRAPRAPGAPGTCMLGSVKTNIGHLEAAAGVAGLIKVVLSLSHGIIPPHLHLTRVNPRIDLDATPFTIPTSASPWPDGARVAGVSSFGFGGTNAHVVLAAAPTRTRPPVADPFTTAVVLSARTDTALAALAARTARALGAHRASLLDTAYTLNAGRARHPLRVSFAAHDARSLAAALEAFAERRSTVPLSAAGGGRVGFVFSGQGAQKAGMGRALYESDAVFKDTLHECARVLERRLERPLLSLLWGPDTDKLDETMFTQPALFALELALARTWLSWGVQPAVVVGHSIGELVAATFAGACTLEEGLKLVVERGRLMQELPRDGAMVSVVADEAEVRAALAGLEGTVNVSAVNAPGSIVLSGVTADVERVTAVLVARGRRATRLAVSHAFHSPLMAPMLDPFERAAAAVDWRALQIPLASNVSGEVRAVGSHVDATYWRRHARDCVRFADNIAAASNDVDLWIEIGPRGTLTALGKRTSPQAAWIASLPTGDEDRAALTVAAASADAAGARVDWEAVYRPWGARRTSLPGYPFERERHWLAAAPLSPGESGASRLGEQADAPHVKAPRDEMAELAREQQRLLARLAGIADRQRALVDDLASAPTIPPVVAHAVEADVTVQAVAPPALAVVPATPDDALELVRNIGRFPLGYVTPAGRLIDLGFDSIMLLELRAALGVSAPVAAIDALGLGARVQDVIDLVVASTRAAPRPLVAPAAPLEAWLRQHVCIDPPYFALHELRIDGDALHARVTRETALLREVGPMSAAEAGRHMALLGACAVAVAAPSPTPAFQLARRAIFRRVAAGPADADRCDVRTRVVERTNSAARATSSLAVDGETIFEAEVEYAILSPRAFELAFAKDIARAREVRAHEAPGPAQPYAMPIELDELRVDDGVATAVIRALPAWACAGHFETAPAMPVAFLMSCLSKLATELFAADATKLVVESADVSAPSLAFAGARVEFRATASSHGTCSLQAHVDGRLVATGTVVMVSAQAWFPPR